MAAHDHTHAAAAGAKGTRLTELDLGRLSLSAGEAYRLEFGVDPGAFQFGGGEYRLEQAPVSARLDVSRTASGFALRLRFSGRVTGPCMRCLEPASAPVEIDAREIDQPASRDEELTSPYVDGGSLALAAWAHDALALALPQRILCRAECAGLCPVCGASLNDADPGAHEHERAPDPRWAKLRELQ